MRYAKKVLVAFDQLVNAFCGGWPDETLSSRAWRWETDGKRAWPRKLIDRLFFWETDHCRASYESELARKQCPVEMRGSEARAS